MVDLVPDAHVRPLLVVRIPPLPALHVVVRVRESVQTLDGLEVADVHELILRLAVGGVGPGRHSQKAEFFVVAFEIVDHLREEFADLLDAGREDAEGVVVAEADVEDCDAGVGGLVAVVSRRVREGGGELLHDYAVHHGVGFPACGDGGRVGGGVDDPCYRGQESDAAYEEEGEGLDNGTESKPCGDSQLIAEQLGRRQFLSCRMVGVSRRVSYVVC